MIHDTLSTILLNEAEAVMDLCTKQKLGSAFKENFNDR